MKCGLLCQKNGVVRDNLIARVYKMGLDRLIRQLWIFMHDGIHALHIEVECQHSHPLLSIIEERGGNGKRGATQQCRMIKRLCKGLIYAFQKERLIVLCHAHQAWDDSYNDMTVQVYDLDILKIGRALHNDVD